ncbi:MAG: nucleotidyl transferase AbiEii/AbiGii toxin family protein [Candidatus Margulisiibacteriota bacterium]
MNDNLHLEVLPKRQRELFYSLSRRDWISDFYLAGGTALALQIAHRRSIDFDFFSEKDFDLLLLKKKLPGIGDYALRSESEIILDGDINGVRISFFKLPWPLIGKELHFNNLRIASKEDIAAMKLSSLSMRGSRKDFIDLYFLLEEYTLEEMFWFFEKKYGKNEENVYCALKGIVYFVDAEKRPMPGLLRHVTWGNIKKRIISAHKEYIEELRHRKGRFGK